MYRVMIVDDEVTIREKMPQLIDFNQYGFEVCGTARNGHEALQQLETLQPDLILLDVRMPVLDGIGFLKVLRESEFPECAVIILSGYSDFDYARQAMQLGAMGYLTKPVDEDEVYLHLKRLAEQLGEKKQRRTSKQMQQKMEELLRIYNGVDEAVGFQEYFMLHVAVLSSELPYEEKNPYELVEECMRCVFPEGTFKLFRVKNGTYSYLVEKAQIDLASTLLHHFETHQISGVLLLDESIFVDKIGCFRKSYQERQYKMLSQVFHGKRKVIRYCNHAELIDIQFEEDVYLSQLRSLLQQRKKEELVALTINFFDSIAEKKVSLEQVQEINYRIYYLLLDVMSSAMSTKQEATLQPPEWRESPVFLTFQRWKKLQYDQIFNAYDFIEQCHKMSHMGVGGDLLDYVHRHFSEQISIKQVAEHFYLNPVYVGRVFQKATGISFKQYLTELRMEQAKRLLCQTDKLVYQIAEEVGFSESKYFVAKFIQWAGQSPTEFRKQYGS